MQKGKDQLVQKTEWKQKESRTNTTDFITVFDEEIGKRVVHIHGYTLQRQTTCVKIG